MMNEPMYQVPLFDNLYEPLRNSVPFVRYKKIGTAKPMKQLAFSLNGFKGKATSGNISSVSNRITIDTGKFLSPDPRSLKSDWVLSHRVHVDVVEMLVDGHFKKLRQHLNIKLSVNIYKEIIDYLLANLLNAYNQEAQLLYSRSGSNGNKPLIRVVDYFESIGLIRNVIGRNNEYQGNTSWMLPTENLNYELNAAQVRVGLKKGAQAIKLMGRKIKKYRTVTINGKTRKESYYARGKEKEIKTGNKAKRLQVAKLSAPVEAFNKMWLEHDLTLDGLTQVPFCKRSFTHNLDLGGRFYGSIQSMKKDRRYRLLIDDERTVEPDFKALHLCLLYARAGKQLNPVESDPYKVERFARDTIKLAMLKFVNSENIACFKGNVTKSGNPINKKYMQEYTTAMITFIQRSSKGLPAKEPIKGTVAKGFIFNMPDHINGSELVEAILSRHESIRGLMNTPDIGLKLQFLDSQIMANVLLKLSTENIPVIPVHDSVRCRVSDVAYVVEVMEQAYRKVVGFDGIVEIPSD